MPRRLEYSCLRFGQRFWCSYRRRCRLQPLLWPRRWRGPLFCRCHCSSLPHDMRQCCLPAVNGRGQLQGGRGKPRESKFIRTFESMGRLPSCSGIHHEWRSSSQHHACRQRFLWLLLRRVPTLLRSICQPRNNHVGMGSRKWSGLLA